MHLGIKAHLPPLPGITPAKRCSSSPSSLYEAAVELFGTRGCQREYLDRIRAALLEAGSDPRQQVEAIVRAHVLSHLQLPLLARVASVEIRHLDERDLAAVLTLRGEAGRLFIDVIARGQNHGTFAVANPARATRAIADMGIRIAEWTPPAAPEEHESLAEDYIEIALRILGAAPSG